MSDNPDPRLSDPHRSPSFPPPPVERSSNAIWFVLGAIVVVALIALAISWERGEPVPAAPPAGTETPAPAGTTPPATPPATPAPTPSPAPTPAPAAPPATPAPATPAPATPAPEPAAPPAGDAAPPAGGATPPATPAPGQ